MHLIGRVNDNRRGLILSHASPPCRADVPHNTILAALRETSLSHGASLAKKWTTQLVTTVT